MPFSPAVGGSLEIDRQLLQVVEHPVARGMPYGQEGRAGTVYQLHVSQNGHPESNGWGGDHVHRALKVFKPSYRIPALVSLAERLESFASVPGLEVCRRSVLTPQRHSSLLHAEPDLTYAVLMPWITGPTWMEILLDERALTQDESLMLARGLAELLATMEQRGIAHCDLSGPNVLIPGMQAGGADPSLPMVALVDVEQIFGPGLTRPEVLTSGSPGYAQHRGQGSDAWESRADRFAGAVLLAEMLAWCDPRVREATWGETYFDPDETQTDSERYQTLLSALRDRWGTAIPSVFQRAWDSEVLADCPTFGEWLVALPEGDAQPAPVRVESTSETWTDSTPAAPTEMQAQVETRPREAQAPDEVVLSLMSAARRLEDHGNTAAALEVYEQARDKSPDTTTLHAELDLIVEELKHAPAPAPADAPATPPEMTHDPTAFLAEGTLAFQAGRWAEARELLNEAIRWLPEKSRELQQAQQMIRTAERRLAPARSPLPWALAIVGLVMLTLGGAAIFGYQRQLDADAEQARVASVAATAEAQATQQALQAAARLAQDEANRSAAATAAALATFNARPTMTAVPTSTPSPIATPTVDALWLEVSRRLDSVWQKDWPASIKLLETFNEQFPRYLPAQEKLYGALVAYGENLVDEDKLDDAVKRFEQAQAIFPDRGEAASALLALTPTPVPTAVPVFRPSAPAPVAPSGPIRAPAPAAGATKSPLAPR